MTGHMPHTASGTHSTYTDLSALTPAVPPVPPDVRGTLELLLLVLTAPSALVEQSSSISDPPAENALPSPLDDTPRGTVLTPQQARVVLSARDAELLVIAMGATLRLGAGGGTTLNADDVGRVRRLATVVHRTLPPSVRAGIRERAARMTLAAAPTLTNDGLSGGW